ncbi:hypothetical protein NUW58_g4404 [Xylaria curta]|uniref:Uncharacterized protein n=1 Tax=Xylaria curta TaxID=42375 RepID=A0ACC1P922_9PEZI|nr:hypothetical protein NUW58_g4404 [Xylaria curta]
MPQQWQVARKGPDGVLYVNNNSTSLVQVRPSSPVHFKIAQNNTYFEYKGPSESNTTYRAVDILQTIAKKRCRFQFIIFVIAVELILIFPKDRLAMVMVLKRGWGLHSGLDGTVTYLSTRGEGSFMAETPANSPHAAKLAQVALSIQEGRPRGKSGSGPARATITEGFSRPQIQYGANVPGTAAYAQYDDDSLQQANAQHTVSSPRYHTASEGAAARDGNCPCCHAIPQSHRRSLFHAVTSHEDNEPDTASVASAATMASSATAVSSIHMGSFNDSYDPRHPPTHHGAYEQPQVPVPDHLSRQVQRSSVHTTPHVTKYTTETTTAYQVDSGKGKLYVSAPIGSNEGRLFDTIADAHSVRSQSQSYDNKEVTRGHRSKEAKRGWRW